MCLPVHSRMNLHVFACSFSHESSCVCLFILAWIFVCLPVHSRMNLHLFACSFSHESSCVCLFILAWIFMCLPVHSRIFIALLREKRNNQLSVRSIGIIVRLRSRIVDLGGCHICMFRIWKEWYVGPLSVFLGGNRIQCSVWCHNCIFPCRNGHLLIAVKYQNKYHQQIVWKNKRNNTTYHWPLLKRGKIDNDNMPVSHVLLLWRKDKTIDKNKPVRMKMVDRDSGASCNGRKW